MTHSKDSLFHSHTLLIGNSISCSIESRSIFSNRRISWQLGFFSTWVLLTILYSTPCIALESESVVSREILERETNKSWFDSTKDDWIYPPAKELTTSEKALDERSKYVVQPKSPDSSATKSWWDWFENFWSGKVWGDFGDWLSGFGDVFILVLRIVSVLVIVLLVAFLILAIVNGTANPLAWRMRRNKVVTSKTFHDPAKIVDLPFAIESSTGDLLSQAEAYRKSGDYSRSIIHLFGHVLFELDAHNLIHLQRSKTNRMYLRELKPFPEIAKYHYYLIEVFEAVFFGRYPIKQEQCDRCWNLLPRLQQAIETARKAQHDESLRIAPVVPEHPLSLSKTLGFGLVICTLVMGGCSGRNKVPTEAYGESSGQNERIDLGGLGLFRSMCEEKGCRTFIQKTLTSRAYRLDWIVWTPKDFRLPNAQEIQWFNDWLSTEKARTLVFVGRDYSPSASYWRQAARSASPTDRAIYRVREAFANNQLEALRYESLGSNACDWFKVEAIRKPSRVIEQFQGVWAESITDTPSHVVLRTSLTPQTGSWVHKPVPLPNSQLFNDNTTDQSLQLEAIDHGRPKVDYLLKSKTGEPLIWRMRYKHWGESQVIVFSNASLLTNEGLTKTGNQKLVAKLLEEFPPKMRLGFLSNSGNIFVRQLGEPEEPEGFAMLRVWPLSLLSMHGLFVGFIAILALWPIFGRPQRLPSPSTADFGKHIEALGDLLYRSRDREYALQRIAEYFREVRRDSSSPWSEHLNDLPPSNSPKAP